jgi:LmbE family N-acetylglucosaminyl deacetylase
MAAAETLGIQVREILPLPNRRLFDSFDNRVALAQRIRYHRPKIVIGFGDKTPLASPDHYQATLITDAAIFYSRLTKWDEHFDGLPVHTVQRQLYFRLPFENPALPGFDSQVTVDISDTLDQKLKSIACYKTQFPAEKAYIFERVRGAAWAAGGQVGSGAGEVFVCAKPLWVKDLVQTVLD